MVYLLHTVGGKDIFDTTRRIMSRLITNDLACQFNWTGKHNRASFAELKNIKKLMILAIRKNNKLAAGATENDVERAMKIWLRNAPDREGGRSRRKSVQKS
ncbi:hypothetical protein FQR65_LT13771 [Abscondita terminalis]|nr:hypothetical protein FQR65_LT13771 [Abscondita terminalis]